MFASTKGKQQKYFRYVQCQERCIDHIPLSFVIIACTVFPTTFLKKSVYDLIKYLPCIACLMIKWSEINVYKSSCLVYCQALGTFTLKKQWSITAHIG